MSGKQSLAFHGSVDLSAPEGDRGELLLDPKNIIVATGGGALPGDVDEFLDNPALDATIDPGTIVAALDMADMTLAANNDITVEDSVDASTNAGNGDLTMQAGRSIDINDSIILRGAFTATANDPGADPAYRDPGYASFTMAPGTTIDTSANGDNIIVRLDVGPNGDDLSEDIGGINLNAGAGHIWVQNSGSTPFSDIIGGGSALLTGSSAALEVNGAGGDGGIGPLNVTVTNLEVRGQSGGVTIRSQTQGLTLGGAALGGLSGVSAPGGGRIEIDVRNGGDLTISEPVVADGDGGLWLHGYPITIEAGGDVDSGTGFIGLISDTHITLEAGATVGATTTGGILLQADSNGSGVGTVTTNSGSTIGNPSAALVSLKGDDLALGASVSGADELRIMPIDVDNSMGIGDGAPGDFRLDSTEIGYLSDGFSLITLGRPDGSRPITVNGVTFTDPVLIQRPAGGSITVDGQITGADNASITLDGVTTTLNADIVTEGNAITISDSVMLGARATVELDTTNGGLTPAGANVTITGPVDDDELGTTALMLDAGAAGNVDFQDAVGAVTPLRYLTATANTISAHAVTTRNTQRYWGATTLNGDVLTVGNDITFNDSVILGSPATITLDTTDGGTAPAGGNVTIAGAVDDDIAGTSTLVIDGGAAGDVWLQGAVGAGAPIAGLTATGGAISVQAVTVATTGDQHYTADEIDFLGGAGSIIGSGDLTLEPWTETQAIEIAGAADTGAGVLDLTQTDLAALQDGFSSITIGRADGQHAITVNPVTFYDPITIQTPQGGSITVDGRINGADNASITLDGSGATTTLNADIVTECNAIEISCGVVLGDPGTVVLDTTSGASAGANITITGDVDDDVVGTSTFLVDGGAAGDVDLQRAVGGATPLMRLGALGNTISVRAVTTTTHQQYIADEIDFLGGPGTIIGSGHLNLQPWTDQAVEIAGAADTGAGVLDLTQTDLAALQDGFSLIFIGGPHARGAVTVNPVTFYDPVLIQTPLGSSITVNGQITGADNASITLDGPGATTTLNANIVTEGNDMTIGDSVILGSPATVTLDTTNGGAVPTGANVTITGPVNDDVVGTTTFVVDGGAAGDVDLQGAVGAGTAVAALSATAGGLELDGATAAGDVSLVSSLADIILTGVQSGGLVLINSAGAILDGGEAVTDVIAPDLELLAQSGIGASADHLEIDADTVAADTTSGGIYLDDVAGGLTIGAVDVTEGAAVTDGNPDDAIYITAHSPLHINADVTNVGGGRIELDAAGTAEQDDLIVAADVKLTTTITGQIQLEAGSEVIILGLVQTEGGDVAANSGDQIIVNGGAIQTGAGAVDLSAPNDVQVTGGSNIISQSGSIAVTSQANLTVTGNVASDSGDVVLTATGDQLSLLGSVTSAAGEVQLVAGDTIVVEGSVSSGGDITLSSGDRISLGPASTIESQSGDAFLVAFDLDAEPGSTVIAPQGMVKISKPLNLDIVIPATAATQIAALLSGAHGSAGATTLASSGAGEVQDGTSGTPEGEEKEKKKKQDEETS